MPAANNAVPLWRAKKPRLAAALDATVSRGEVRAAITAPGKAAAAAAAALGSAEEYRG